MYEPRYIITHKILRNIGHIDGAREVIEHAALVPAWEAKFRQDALSRTVHHGTHIEGNELSLAQAEKLVVLQETMAEPAAEKAGIVGRDRDVQEVINYRKVIDWIDEQGLKGKDKIQLNEKALNEIHHMVSYRTLPDEDRGVFRKVQVVVKNSRTGEISFRPPPAVEVSFQIEEFFEWLNSSPGNEHHAVIRAAITHYELTRIHPYTDGNGRTARAMALLVMYTGGYDVKRFFSLEEYFDNNASDYYQALQSVGADETYDLSYWLEYFTTGLAFELDKIKNQVLKLSKDVQLKTKLGVQVPLSERQIKILETMRNNGGKGISSDFEELLPMISVDTILRDLKDLIHKGVIKKKGRTKGAFYQLVE